MSTRSVPLLALVTASCGQKLVTDSLKPAQKNTSESVASASSGAPYCGVNTSGAVWVLRCENCGRGLVFDGPSSGFEV